MVVCHLLQQYLIQLCFVSVRSWCLSTFCWLVNLQQILNACKFLTGLQLSSGRPFLYNCYFCLPFYTEKVQILRACAWSDRDFVSAADRTLPMVLGLERGCGKLSVSGAGIYSIALVLDFFPSLNFV
jgi:hypothetical protein